MELYNGFRWKIILQVFSYYHYYEYSWWRIFQEGLLKAKVIGMKMEAFWFRIIYIIIYSSFSLLFMLLFFLFTYITYFAWTQNFRISIFSGWIWKRGFSRIFVVGACRRTRIRLGPWKYPRLFTNFPHVCINKPGEHRFLIQLMACHLFGAKPLPEPLKFESKHKNLIHENSFEKSSLKWWPFCPGGDELKKVLI